MDLELHPGADGNDYGLGLTDPQPADFKVGAARGFKVLTLDQIRAELAARNSGKVGYYSRRSLFDLSWNANQRSKNSCNGWAAARALARAFYLKCLVRQFFSGSDLYARMNGGRDAGSSLANGMNLITEGVALESSVPWDMIYERDIPASAKAERQRFRGHEPIAVDSQEEFATGLLLGFQGVVAVQVDRSGRYESLDGNGVSRGGNGPGNHAVGVDDLRLASDGTIEFDQYGSWGEHCARVWLRWDQHLVECARRHRFWLLAAAVEDPNGTNPPSVKE